MYYLYDPNDYEYRGISTQQTENSTTISPFVDGSNTVVGNYFDIDAQKWINKSTISDAQKFSSLMKVNETQAQLIASLSNDSKQLKELVMQMQLTILKGETKNANSN